MEQRNGKNIWRGMRWNLNADKTRDLLVKDLVCPATAVLEGTSNALVSHPIANQVYHSEMKRTAVRI
ncbi:hypothetical protein R3I94_018731 [Phoxinus phoxinus]